MRRTFNLSYIELHDSEVYLKFVDSECPTFLDFLVSIPKLNRSLNDALNCKNLINPRFSINGVSFPISLSELIIVKKHFDYLTK